MSNPAVITLVDASSKKGKFKRFVIEDNIGESIHLHIDNMRVDFTIKEFLEFSSMIRESLAELDILKPYSIDNFDEHFINECAPFLSQLKEIKIEEIQLSKLQCIVHSNYKTDLNLVKLAPISKIAAFDYLNGKKSDFLNYNQFNYNSINNESRLNQTLESIKTNGYPFKEKYIVLFEGQDIIRDGQHRAAILAHLHGLDYKIKVMRFYFNGNRNEVKPLKDNLKVTSLWLAKKVYRKLKKVAKKVLNRPT